MCMRPVEHLNRGDLNGDVSFSVLLPVSFRSIGAKFWTQGGVGVQTLWS